MTVKEHTQKSYETKKSNKLDDLKVPPHSIEAEQSVLGGLLLDNSAWEGVSELLTERDFYRSEHKIIFQAAAGLLSQGKALDVLTLAETLKTNNELDGIGSDIYLFELSKNTPSIANIAAYAEIVRERSILRQMIAAASEIANMAYQPAGRLATELLDNAEQKVFQIAEQSSRGQGPQPIRPLAIQALKNIDERYRNPSAVTGTPTGFLDLDNLTSGLQPADLVILAGRPSMGKTMLGINIAEHVALDTKKPVLIFSMEMPADAIVMRMISSLGRIDQQAVRSGQLSKEDWPRIGSTINLIAEAPIFIDDTPALTPGELRSRARRVAREQKGLQLIVVDYLQLMRVNDDPENRTAEISEISRSLKALAKELHVPIVALSQLNRGLEQRADKRPMMSDLRECVTGETLVNLADGRRIPIAQLVGQEIDVIAVNEHKKLVNARCDKIWSVGNKQVYKIGFSSGKTLRATKEHRIMTFKGWMTINDLEINDRIATARVLPEPRVKNIWSEHQLILLAHMMGDGSYLKHQPMRYTTCSEENSSAVKMAAELGFGMTVKKYESGRSWHQLVLSGNGTRWQPAGVNKWLRELNVFNQRSHEKHVPSEVFTLSNQQIGLFLKHLWATDGCIFVKKENERGADVIHYSTNSILLAKDVTSLLLRFGIVARIKKTQKGNYRPGYLVVITGVEQQKKFISEIGAFGPRVVQAEALLKKIVSRKSNTNVDTVPVEVFEEVKMVMNARGISQRQMANLRGTSYGGTSHFKFEPSRAVLSSYANLLNDDNLKHHANNDIFWDKIVSIEPDGEEEVYDLTVPGLACWLADSIVSHNSGAIEQDADLIIFIYRDEVYHPNTSDAKNVAEIILAKHRNGPIGKIRLNFCGPYVRFDNLAQRYVAESLE